MNRRWRGRLLGLTSAILQVPLGFAINRASDHNAWAWLWLIPSIVFTLAIWSLGEVGARRGPGEGQRGAADSESVSSGTGSSGGDRRALRRRLSGWIRQRTTMLLVVLAISNLLVSVGTLCFAAMSADSSSVPQSATAVATSARPTASSSEQMPVCEKEQIYLVVEPRFTQITPGRGINFNLRLRSKSKYGCRPVNERDGGVVSILDEHRRLVWSSEQCPSSVEQVPAINANLAPKTETKNVEIRWNGRYSTPRCATQGKLPAVGKYTAIWKIGIWQSGPAQIEVVPLE
jgi:hypothetical protein